MERYYFKSIVIYFHELKASENAVRSSCPELLLVMLEHSIFSIQYRNIFNARVMQEIQEKDPMYNKCMRVFACVCVCKHVYVYKYTYNLFILLLFNS